jgi:hypothetical protein
VGRDAGMRENNQSATLITCIYCGSTENLTDEHIPPRNIFPKPRPNKLNLITVPACKKCNTEYSKDDEYFRLKLCMSENVKDNSDARKNRDIIFRSLNRPEAKGFRNSFIGDISKLQVRTPGRIYLKRKYVFDVDLKRIFSVVEKTVRGLYFHETGYRLDDGCDVDIHSDDTLKGYSSEIMEEMIQKILIPLSQKPPKVIGNNTFLYRFHIAKENPSFSVWALTFYGQVNFLSITGPSRGK